MGIFISNSNASNKLSNNIVESNSKSNQVHNITNFTEENLEKSFNSSALDSRFSTTKRFYIDKMNCHTTNNYSLYYFHSSDLENKIKKSEKSIKLVKRNSVFSIESNNYTSGKRKSKSFIYPSKKYNDKIISDIKSNTNISINPKNNILLESYCMKNTYENNKSNNKMPVTILSKLSKPYKKSIKNIDNELSIKNEVSSSNEMSIENENESQWKNQCEEVVQTINTPDFYNRNNEKIEMNMLKKEKVNLKVIDLLSNLDLYAGNKESNEKKLKSVSFNKNSFLFLKNLEKHVLKTTSSLNLLSKNPDLIYVNLLKKRKYIKPKEDNVQIIHSINEKVYNEDKENLRHFLLSFPCLSGCLEYSQIDFLCNRSIICKTNHNEFLWSFDTSPIYVFIKINGDLLINFNSTEKDFTLYNKISFGEREIISKSNKRKSEIICLSDCLFICIPKEDFLIAIEKSYKENNIKAMSILLEKRCSFSINPLSKSRKYKSLYLPQSESNSLINENNSQISKSGLIKKLSSKKVIDNETYNGLIEIGILENLCFLYKILPDEFEKKLFISSLIPEIYDNSNVIINKDEELNCLYIVGKGKVCSISNILSNPINKNGSLTNCISNYNPGDIFGISNLYHKEYRNLEYISMGYTIVYLLPYEYIISNINNYEKHLAYSILYSYKYLNNINKYDSNTLFPSYPEIDIMIIMPKEKIFFNDIVNSKSDYIIYNGVFENEKVNKILIESGQKCINYEILIKNNIESDLRAKTYMIIIKVKNDKVNILDDSILKDYNNRKLPIKIRFLMRNSFFSHFSSNFLKEIAKNMIVKYFKKGDLLYSYLSENVYIIKEGSVSISKINGKDNRKESLTSNKYSHENYSRILYENEIFGLNSLIYENKDDERYEKAEVLTELSEIYIISYSDWKRLFPKTRYVYNFIIGNYIISNEKENIFIESSYIVNDKNEKYAYNKYKIIENNNFLYLIKCFPISIIKEKMENIMRLPTNPFHMSYVKTFKLKENYIFLYKFIKCHTLEEFLVNFNNFNHQKDFIIKFIATNMLFAIDYLHNNRIIHRDIRPFVFNINQQGYLFISDYSFIKSFNLNERQSKSTFLSLLSNNQYEYNQTEVNNTLNFMSKDDRTNTIVGNFQYMSPEIVYNNKNYYSYYIDYWSFGVSLYEIACGQYPFGNENEDPYDIYHNILNGNIIFPNELTLNLKDLIKKLLEVRLDQRLINIKQIFSHKFFFNTQIEEIYNLTYQSPITIPLCEYAKLKRICLIERHFD